MSLDERIVLRCDKETKDIIQQKAKDHGLSLAGYIRLMVTKGTVEVK